MCIRDSSSAFVLQAPFGVAEPISVSGFSFNNDGTRVIVLTGSARVASYPLSVAYDITTIGDETSYTEKNLIGLGGLNTSQSLGPMYFKPDGTRFYVGGRRSATNNAVYQYDLSSPWDITTAIYSGQRQTLLATTTKHRPWFSPDGTKLVVGIGASSITSFAYYELATAWDIAGSITFSSTYTLTAGPNSRHFAFSSDGFTIYTIDVFDKFNTISLPSAFRPTSGRLIRTGPFSDDDSPPFFNSFFTRDIKIYNGDFYVAGSDGLTELVITSDPGNITNLLNTPLTIGSTGIGYTRFMGTNGIVIPAGTSGQRPPSPELGDTRWNITEQYLECFDGSVYVIATGGGDLVTQQFMEDLGFIYSAILG